MMDKVKKVQAETILSMLALSFCLVVFTGCEKSQDELDAELFEAVRSADVGDVRELIDEGGNVNAKAADGGTPLHVAAAGAQKEIVEILLAAGAEVDAIKEPLKFTHLHSAGFLGRHKENAVAGPLIKAGADVNVPDDRGRTPLHVATGTGTIGVIADLIAAGADLNARDNKGRTPLHTAAAKLEYRALQLLIEAGADVNAKTGDGKSVVEIAEDKRFLTPWAKALVNQQIVPLLLAAGATQ